MERYELFFFSYIRFFRGGMSWSFCSVGYLLRFVVWDTCGLVRVWGLFWFIVEVLDFLGF